MSGFIEKFGRHEGGFVYIETGAAQMMLEALPDDPSLASVTGDLDPPFRRGVNL
ncbi:hypothetical protein AAD018_009490 [Aestuariibius insulae]|uniref:hypothetical protein n=1 Tax=Aestuariibius insulae TaxID=2058287 RepID=UPI00398E8436